MSLAGPLPFRVERKEGEADPPAGFVAHRGRDLPAPRLDFVFKIDLPAELHWGFLFPAGGEEWDVAGSREGVLEFTSAASTGFVLDTARWQLAPLPRRRTSG